MDPVCLEFLKQFWSTQATLSYDTSDIYLMHNEVMGYLMQQSLRELKDILFLLPTVVLCREIRRQPQIM